MARLSCSYFPKSPVVSGQCPCRCLISESSLRVNYRPDPELLDIAPYCMTKSIAS